VPVSGVMPTSSGRALARANYPRLGERWDGVKTVEALRRAAKSSFCWERMRGASETNGETNYETNGVTKDPIERCLIFYDI
jgi:hypothetical protein